MKSFLITMLFFCLSLVVYSQTDAPPPKGLQYYKFNYPLKPILTPTYALGSLNATVKALNNMPCFVPDMSVVTPIPNYTATGGKWIPIMNPLKK